MRPAAKFSGTLYIVSTPIGNLEDITLRALRVLKEVDLIAAEDTRRTRQLLSHYGIHKPLLSYHEHNRRMREESLLEELRGGKSIALVTDAGTPGISDPGEPLVRRAVQESIPLVPIPGPSALVAALSVSGLPTESFLFYGFLPSKAVGRQKLLLSLKDRPETLIFYESPRRLRSFLEDASRILGERQVMVAREIILADFTGTAVHIAHVSTAGAVQMIRDAKARGIRITAETAPHYFTLTDEALRKFDTNTRVNPPLRGSEDVAAIREGLRDGTIDAIATDHAPHACTDKDVEFEYAASGIAGLETALSLSLKLVEEGVLTLGQLIRVMSTNPAGILRVPGGTLEPGAAADITVIDLNREWVVDPTLLRSQGKNTPFAGWTLKGKAVMTMVGGEIKLTA